MSGDVLLVTGVGMPLQAMFAAVATIDEYLPNRHALIGGLAVMIRVADAHRATGDIDEVAFGTEPEPAQILVDAGVAVSTSTRSTVEAGGVKIDIIAVDDYDLAELPDEGASRMFVLSHRWALDTATPVSVGLVDHSGAVLSTTTTNVAARAALVACKAQSSRGRRAERGVKQASDLYDLYRLLQSDLAAGRTVVSTLATAPADLGEWTLAQLRERFVDDGPSTVRMISNLALAGPVTVDDLAGVYAAVTANR